ncbi:hypothetical protein [Sphingomonas koreensis]
MERLDKLPDWPARMTAPVAAAYMGVSPNTFTARYAEYSRKEGANVFWAKVQLDRLIAEQFEIELKPQLAGAGPIDTGYDEWKAGRREK